MRLYVGVSCAEQPRFADFWDTFLHLQFPNETVMEISRGAVISVNRNQLTKRALAVEADYIFYVDDDHIFSQETIMRLLAHEVDVVSALYLSRVLPFNPHTYDTEDSRGFVGQRLFSPNDKGLVKVKACGAGALLVKMDVIKKLEYPYWTLGQIDKENWSDDVDFCRRVRGAGFDINVDMSTPVGHKVTGTLWPEKIDGKWITTLVLRARGESNESNDTREIPAARFPQKMNQSIIIPDGGGNEGIGFRMR